MIYVPKSVFLWCLLGHHSCYCGCSYALFDMDGLKVPQELVTEVGETFKILSEEVLNNC